MLIDCDICVVRGVTCARCRAIVATGSGPEPRLTADERRAIEMFTRAGFEVEVLREPVPAPLRLLPRAARPRRRAA